MNIEIILALVLFAFASSISPGPNNLMLMSSGANFGFRKTLPHMMGVGLGFTLMVALVGMGVMQVFDLYPASYMILKWCSIVYLVYLSYKVATSAPPENKRANKAKPFSFIQAVLFQWVNPKAWTMALTSIGIYAPDRDVKSVIIVALVFGAVNLPSISVWVVLGQKLQKILSSVKRLRIFNGIMAFLLLASLYPVLIA
ncbi:MAG: threonine/homoserine/homoserine lactone efflux protein [Psychrosphaera sp.]|jgi:threonine/homoserine/homoserine lactone efflux protein|uniref:LysE family translocator n=1 Tax=Psychrosphaera aquimarina TaxID=2044854 RepID=A0ABU3R2G4_9GAMM|nr:LysE family translocator [Psychrosphaera aquimarina]MBU2919289.1 LysE family translocator [Psychrosphaera sp. F3M07]MDU0113871.1 LysE family translocator [Psychrosphaera aquimarina]